MQKNQSRKKSASAKNQSRKKSKSAIDQTRKKSKSAIDQSPKKSLSQRCYFKNSATKEQLNRIHLTPAYGWEKSKILFAVIFTNFPELCALCSRPNISENIFIVFPELITAVKALILMTHYTTSNEDVYLNEWVVRLAIHSIGQHEGNTKYKTREIQNTTTKKYE